MADETVINGAGSDLELNNNSDDDKLVEIEKVSSKNDHADVDLKKIETLEQEKSELLKEKNENHEKIRVLTDEIDGFKRNQVELNEKLEKMQKENAQFEQENKSLQSIAGRALELETEVSRLQHDLISTMSENDETRSEFQKLKSEFNELKEKIAEKESKIGDLEKEKISLLERNEKDAQEVKKLKSENETNVRDLKAREVEISEKEGEILRLQNVENDFNKWKVKLNHEKEAENKQLLGDLEKSEMLRRELEEDAKKEKETGKSKILLPAVIVSTGTVVAAAAIICCIACIRRR
ncbi:peroxisomal and mitochondrial division factor 1-like [Papaver somniferum]|uniref:peroxisomal and mitochondrial division factor 1-like n=1 Tax=Papaver somniferum TaxID=3469 RepID=UPI000E6FF4D6|nr:peroxisomal and mitochondrial division factor 1-like [Papaver somniferum]